VSLVSLPLSGVKYTPSASVKTSSSPDTVPSARSTGPKPMMPSTPVKCGRHPKRVGVGVLNTGDLARAVGDLEGVAGGDASGAEVRYVGPLCWEIEAHRLLSVHRTRPSVVLLCICCRVAVLRVGFQLRDGQQEGLPHEVCIELVSNMGCHSLT
jgi:hypothetical protein